MIFIIFFDTHILISHYVHTLTLTPKAEYLLVRLFSPSSSNKTIDLGLGGFLGLRMTLTSCLISSSSSLESEDTDNCLGPIEVDVPSSISLSWSSWVEEVQFLTNFQGFKKILEALFNLSLFRNKRFALNEMFQRNTSKFAIFYV